jgi:hypothetical protein
VEGFGTVFLESCKVPEVNTKVPSSVCGEYSEVMFLPGNLPRGHLIGRVVRHKAQVRTGS